MKAAFLSGLSAILLGGCAGVVPPSTANEVAAISYETTPCFGFCPVYKVSLIADGGGTFVGQRHAGFEGTREIRVTPERYAAFVRQLAPLRPARGSVRYDHESCAQMATDLPSVTVTWTGSDGTAQQLYYDYGCDMEKNQAIADRLRAAPDALGIDDLIRPKENGGKR